MCFGKYISKQNKTQQNNKTKTKMKHEPYKVASEDKVFKRPVNVLSRGVALHTEVPTAGVRFFRNKTKKCR